MLLKESTKVWLALLLAIDLAILLTMIACRQFPELIDWFVALLITTVSGLFFAAIAQLKKNSRHDSGPA